MLEKFNWFRFRRKKQRKIEEEIGPIDPCKIKMIIRDYKGDILDDDFYCGKEYNGRLIYCESCLKKRRDESSDRYENPL